MMSHRKQLWTLLRALASPLGTRKKRSKLALQSLKEKATVIVLHGVSDILANI